MRLTPQVIDTAKIIGVAEYRLKCEAGASVVLMPRSAVKKWCFDSFPDICMPIIQRKIEKKGQVYAKTGEQRKPSFVYVDDKIVTECMKRLYKIPLPEIGKGYAHGLKTHSFQALAVASCFIHVQPPSILF